MKFVETIQIVSSRVEILFTRVDIKEKFLVDGLRVGDTHVNFRDAAIKFFPVTVIGLPPEISTAEFATEMRRFGTLIKFYDVYKFVNGQKVKNGNRVYHYQQLVDTIPTRVISDNRVIRLVYNKNISKEFCSDEYWEHLLRLNSNDYSPAKQAATITSPVEEPNNQEEIEMDVSHLFREVEEDLNTQPNTQKIENLINKAEQANPAISENLPCSSQPVVSKTSLTATINNNQISVGKESFVVPVNAPARSLDDLVKIFKTKKYISSYETFLCLPFKNWISLMVALLHFSLPPTEKKSFFSFVPSVLGRGFNNTDFESHEDMRKVVNRHLSTAANTFTSKSYMTYHQNDWKAKIDFLKQAQHLIRLPDDFEF